jgi:RNA polymerase subunit RPABC4/transcription elongation factor Spt4
MDWPGGSWENAAALAVTIAAAYLLVLWISIVAWTYRDIRDRSRDPAFQVVALLLVLVFNIMGWVIYMILRPAETLTEAYARSLEEEAVLQELEEQGICPSCKRYVTGEFVICPYCRTQLKEPCSNCGRPLSFNWVACPFCSTTRAVAAATTRRGTSRPSAEAAGEGTLESSQQRATSPQTSVEP